MAGCGSVGVILRLAVLALRKSWSQVVHSCATCGKNGQRYPWKRFVKALVKVQRWRQAPF
eukprot:4309978-Amphidinium_carterae.1